MTLKEMSMNIDSYTSPLHLINETASEDSEENYESMSFKESESSSSSSSEEDSDYFSKYLLFYAI